MLPCAIAAVSVNAHHEPARLVWLQGRSDHYVAPPGEPTPHYETARVLELGGHDNFLESMQTICTIFLNLWKTVEEEYVNSIKW